MFVSKG